MERYNSSWRYEFYAVYDLPNRLDQLNPLIDAFRTATTPTYPTALGGKTPAQGTACLLAHVGVPLIDTTSFGAMATSGLPDAVGLATRGFMLGIVEVGSTYVS